MPDTAVTWLDTVQVNNPNTGSESNPTVTQLNDGRILVLWDDTGNGNSPGSDVLGQFYDGGGTPIGDEFQVNTSFTNSDEREPNAAATTQGGWLMAFEDSVPSPSNVDVRLERYDASGTRTDAETVLGADNPAVAVSSATSALLVYETSANDVSGRIYNPSTGSLGPEILLIAPVGSNRTPDVAVLSNGNYVIVAENFNSTTGEESIWTRIINPAGGSVDNAQAIGNTTFNNDDDSQPTVAGLTGGGFVVAWTNVDNNDTDIEFQIFNNSGNSTSSVLTVNGGGGSDNHDEPSIQALPDGGFVIFYDDSQIGASGMKFQRYDASGNEVGAEVTIDTDGLAPDLTLLDDGRLALVHEKSGNMFFTLVDTRDATNASGPIRAGTPGSETITEVVGPEQDIFAGKGNDTVVDINGAPNDDEIFDGGEGIDTFQINAGETDNVIINLRSETYQSSSNSNTQEIRNFENATGAEGNDIITGTFGDNTLVGLGGNDRLDGRRGNDRLFGNDGDDFLIYGSNDQIAPTSGTANGGSGTDTLLLISDDDDFDFRNINWQAVSIERIDLEHVPDSDSLDLFLSGQEVDQATEFSPNTVVTEVDEGRTRIFIDLSTAFNDVDVSGWTFNGWEGPDGLASIRDRFIFTDDGGSTTVTGPNVGAEYNMDAGSDVVIAGDGDDLIRGEAGNDILSGGNGRDTLNGGTDNDTLNGNVGNDTLNGDGGDDTLRGQAGTDELNGGDGDDTLDGGGGMDTLNGDAGEDTLNGGGGPDTLNGGDDDDDLFGNAGNDTLNGGDGNDRLFGGADFDNLNGNLGNDFLDGGASNDILAGGGGDDALVGGDGNDNLNGGGGIDVLSGNAGNDVMAGGADNDTLNGGGGNDRLFGGAGDDISRGQAGDDFISSGSGNDTLEGGNDNDSLFGGFGMDTLLGEAGNDFLQAGASNDSLFGGSGNDTLEGREDNDLLNGGTGNDTLIGGTGSDTFVFAEGFGNDTVTDFQDNIDQLDLTAFNFATVNGALSFASEVAGDVVFTFGTDIFTIENITEEQLVDDILI